MKHEITSQSEHQETVARAINQFQLLLAQGDTVSIKKNSKHIFKDREKKPNLDLRQLNRVLSVDTENNIATVEGMTSFYDLLDATLPFNLMPQAVPELRSITVGGAIAGLGGQSSSFKFGLVHEMITDLVLLTGDGRMIDCSADENADLYHMLPNSYGSLGYVLKCNIKLNPVKRFVKVRYLRLSNNIEFLASMEREVRAGQADFVEGVSFSPEAYILLLGSFVDDLPRNEKAFVPLRDPFFKSVRDPRVEVTYLTTRDYIWRWDPDAFWATDQKNIFGSILLNSLFRRILGRYLLRSDRLIKIGKFRNRLRKSGGASFLFQEAKRIEGLIQDAAIPFASAADFDTWLGQTLRIYPLWYCPVRSTKPAGTYPLYQPESEFELDFGFYKSMDLDDDMDDYYYNKQIEKMLAEMGGLKCLYSDTFYSREQFWNIYDKTQYDQVKEKYDPNGTYLNLYDKVANK